MVLRFYSFPFLMKALSLGKASEGNIQRWVGPVIILPVPLLCPHVHLPHIQCSRASGSWEAHGLAEKMHKSGNILTQELEIEVKRNMMHSTFSWHARDLISGPYIIDMKKNYMPLGKQSCKWLSFIDESYLVKPNYPLSSTVKGLTFRLM